MRRGHPMTTAMAKRGFLAWALLALLWLPSLARATVQVPASPQGRVSDYASVLSAPQKEALEVQLLRYERAARPSAEAAAKDRSRAGGPEIAVVIFPGLAGDALEELSMRVAQSWKIGSKADDGVILLVTAAERQIRIEVGYGAEARLPDILCARIIREHIAPRLHNGDYAGALSAGVIAIHQALSGQPVTGVEPPAASEPAKDGKPADLIGPIALFGGLILFALLLGILSVLRGGIWTVVAGLFQFIFSGGRGSSSGGGGSFGGGGASGK